MHLLATPLLIHPPHFSASRKVLNERSFIQEEFRRLAIYCPTLLAGDKTLCISTEDSRPVVMDCLQRIPGIRVLPEDPATPGTRLFELLNHPDETGKPSQWSVRGFSSAH